MGEKIYSTLFSSLVCYEQQVMIEIQNKQKESKQKLKNIELAFVWLKQFKQKGETDD
jgi:hypothetical protein